MSTPQPHPLARLNAEGDRDYFAGLPRDANPYPETDPARALWFAKWDASAQEAARILKASGAQRLYRAGLEASALMKDLREHPRTLSPRSPRFRETEIALNSALAGAMASCATKPSQEG